MEFLLVKKIKKQVGIIFKWIDQIWIGKKSQKVAIDCQANAVKYIDALRPHNYNAGMTIARKTDINCEVSFIIPVYNVEKYLRMAVDSVIRLTQNINKEIILVEDCSTDNSLQICKELEAKYAYVKLLLMKKNGGLAAARNYAMTEAAGKYIYFLDSDDILINFMPLYEAAEKNNADVVEGNFTLFEDGREFDDRKKHIRRCEVGPVDISNNYKLISIAAGFAWGKLYKREIWLDVAFPEGYVFEDTVEEMVVLRKSKRYMFVDMICHGYRQNPKSICHTVNNTTRVFDSFLVYRYWISDEGKKVADDYITFRLTLRQFGAKTYSRIQNHSEKDKVSAFLYMRYILTMYNCKPAKLSIKERFFYKQLINGDFGKWEFLCKYQ